MPTYEFQCQSCQKEFSLIMSMAEHEKGQAKCPGCGKKKVDQIITGFTVVTSKKS